MPGIDLVPVLIGVVLMAVVLVAYWIVGDP